MDLLWETLSFVIKAFVVFVTVAACALVIIGRARASRQSEGLLEVRRLNDVIRGRAEHLRTATMLPKERKRAHKELVRASKKRLERNLFVLDFKGDIMASAAEDLREAITAVLGAAQEGDEVMIRIESTGGAMHSYGFAASQLVRIRKRGLPLTACVDRVAASGGYMMACVASQIIVAPFALVGSIGVAAPMPNVNRLLERFGVSYEDFSAGEYKRTLNPLAKPTEDKRQKFQEQIDDVHEHFKRFVQRNQPSLDIEQVATGEVWLGERAQELGLASALGTSDDFLLNKVEESNILEVTFERPRTVRDRLRIGYQQALAALGRVGSS